jgi:phospholipid transport system substrate-binding protein
MFKRFLAALPAMLFCMTLSLAVSTNAHAGAEAATFVQKMGDKALSSLTAKDLATAERESRVRSLLRTNFDVSTIGRFALGTYWKDATADQRTKYMGLFENMIVKTYSQRFAEYSGQQFKVGKVLESSARDSVVDSQIIQDGGPPVSVQWRVRNKEGQMKVVDVIVEGISMGVTQRSDFAAVIQSGGGKVDALLASLEKRQNAKN